MSETQVAPLEYPMSRDRSCPFAPPAALREAAAKRPLSRVRIWDGSTPWVVTGHAVQRELLSDPRISVDEHRDGFPYFSEAMAKTLDQRPKMIFNLDGEDHRRLRRILTKAFTFKRVQTLRPAIQQIVDDLIDEMLAGPKPADLVDALAVPLPSLMICELLGVPYDDHEMFQRNSRTGVDRRSTAEQSEASIRELVVYLIGLVHAKIDDPGDDVLSDIAALVKAGDVDEIEAGLLGLQVLVAGHETSANMIALGTAALLEHPDQLAVFRDADDPAVIEGATEEMLRYLSITQSGQRRIATADIEVAGEVIREGDGVIIDLPSGNWDTEVFEEPDRLDLTRSARQQQVFGWGAHQCVGQQLARAELQIVYSTLFRRVPTLQLARPLEELPFKHDALAYGLDELPVTW